MAVGQGCSGFGFGFGSGLGLRDTVVDRGELGLWLGQGWGDGCCKLSSLQVRAGMCIRYHHRKALGLDCMLELRLGLRVRFGVRLRRKGKAEVAPAYSGPSRAAAAAAAYSVWIRIRVIL